MPITPVSGEITSQEINDNLSYLDSLINSKKFKQYREKQGDLVADAFKTIRSLSPFSICCMGDSLTYGQDTVSGDIRPADPTPTPNGDAHTATRASITYPEALQTYLGEVYGSNEVSVINRGFSGDTTLEAYSRWTTPSNADVCLIMLGTNDVSGQTIQDFLKWYRLLIERELNNGTAVVILTPPKTRNTTDVLLDSYSNAVYNLGKTYGIEVVDMQEMLMNYSHDIYSDNVHFNGKGYEIIGARIASLFIGDGILKPKIVDVNSSLSIRPMVDSVIYRPLQNIVSASGYPTPDEQVSGQGIGVSLSNGDCLYYSVYVSVNDLLFSPSIYFPGSLVDAKVTIDFGTEIPHMTNDFNRGVTVATPNYRPVNPFTFSKDDVNIDNAIFSLAGVESFNENKIGHLSTKGWHTIKIECVDSGTTGLEIHSLDFTSLRDILTRTKLIDVKNHGSWTTASLQNGATHDATYTIEYRKNQMNFTEMRGALTVGTATSGTVLFTLPAGLRPDRNITLIVSNTGANPIGLLVVRTNGSVELGSSLTSGVKVYLGQQSFEGVL